VRQRYFPPGWRSSPLIDAGASPLRLQRWMGQHSAAFTLDTYGHLLGDDLGPHLDIGFEMP
jgi:hypothetical protein